MLMRQEIWWWVIRAFYICFFLFIINRIFFVSSGMVEQITSCVTYPFLKINTNITHSLRVKSEYAKTVKELQNYVGVLEIEKEFLKSKIARLEAQQYLIEQSKEIVEFSERYNEKNNSLAKILLYYSCPQEDVMFIDGGHNRNYCKDDIVVYKNALIGRIIEVYPWYSKVSLITDQRCRVSAVAGSQGQGISCGKNNNNVVLCFVPHYKAVAVGDLVFSTGYGLVYPSGFILGIVEHVSTDLVSHTITVKPYYNFSEIPYVYVFLKNKDIVNKFAQPYLEHQNKNDQEDEL